MGRLPQMSPPFLCLLAARFCTSVPVVAHQQRHDIVAHDGGAALQRPAPGNVGKAVGYQERQHAAAAVADDGAALERPSSQKQHIRTESLLQSLSELVDHNMQEPAARMGSNPAMPYDTRLDDAKAVTTTIGLMLLGSVAFIMTMFYGVHHYDPDVAHNTWKATSQMASLFCAVLFFRSCKDILVQLGDHPSHINAGPPGTASLIGAFVRWYIIFWLIQGLLTKYRHSELRSYGWGSIGGAVIAFASIDAFGMLMQLEPFRKSPGMAVLGWLIALFMMWMMCLSAGYVRIQVMKSKDGITNRPDMKWHETCKFVENRAVGLCLGFLMSSIVRFHLTGHLPPTDGDPKHKSDEQIWQFLGITLLFCLPVIATSCVIVAMGKHAKKWPSILRFVMVVEEIGAMTVGWCVVFWSQWYFWSSSGIGIGNQMNARIVCALAVSYVGFTCIFFIDRLADKLRRARAAFDAVVRAIILGVAMGWEGAFDKSIDSIGAKVEGSVGRLCVEVVLSAFLCSLIIPAWTMYILPRDMAGPMLSKAERKARKAAAAGDLDAEELALAALKAEEEAAAEEAAAAAAKVAEDAKVALGGDSAPLECFSCAERFLEDDVFCGNCGEPRSTFEPKAAGGTSM